MSDNSTVSSRFSFTKAIVDDVQKMAEFYQTVFGMREIAQVQDQIDNERIDEVILIGSEGDMATQPTLVLLKFVDKPAPAASDMIIGFITTDLEELLVKVADAGGKVITAPRKSHHMNPAVSVAFARDPEGRLLELVQML